MKKLATTLFGLFLVATSFANVKGHAVTKIEKLNATTQTVQNKTTLNNLKNVMTLNAKAAIGGPRVVVQTCKDKCEDDL